MRELREFADTAGIHAYDQKTTLFKEGGVSKKFYIVVSGHVGIYQKRENGKQTKIRWLRAGNYFGEIGMVTGMPHTATAIAAAGTVLLTADDAAFSAMYQDNRTVLTELKLRMMGDESHISLVLVLQHVRGYQMLLKFCKKEMNEENMVFWKDVDNLENYIRKYLRILKVNHEEGLTIKEDKEQKHERLRRSVIDLSILSKPILSIMHHCNKIMTKYILESGDMQVNVPDTMRNEAVKNFSEYFAVHFEGAPAFVKPDPKRPAREDNIKLLDRIIIACIKPGTHTSVGTTTEQDEFNAEEEEEMNSLMKHSLSSKTTRDQDCAPISEVIAAFEMILDLFAPSRKEILHMLESDGYRRWKTTADYKEFLSLIVAYEGVPDAYKKTLMPPENSDYEDF